MIDKTLLSNGVIQYTFWDFISAPPVGFIWIIITEGESGKRIALILNMYTASWARRKGICRKLIEEINSNCDIVVTASGSLEGGKDFLNNIGFLYHPGIDMWIYKK